MQTITETAVRSADGGVFTREQAGCWLNGEGARLDALLKRGVAKGELRRVRRGLYCLSSQYLTRAVNPFGLAQRVYGPSYISLESALSYHGWIPEAVQTITSASVARSREFDTPVGLFSFTRVPQRRFFAGVVRIAEDRDAAFLLANPLKALADYVYAKGCDWAGAKPVLGSLRVEAVDLETLTGHMFDELATVYRSGRVCRFLQGLRRDLRL